MSRFDLRAQTFLRMHLERIAKTDCLMQGDGECGCGCPHCEAELALEYIRCPCCLRNFQLLTDD